MQPTSAAAILNAAQLSALNAPSGQQCHLAKSLKKTPQTICHMSQTQSQAGQPESWIRSSPTLVTQAWASSQLLCSLKTG